jgi:hypothetical protein
MTKYDYNNNDNYMNMITVRSVRLFAADCLLYRRVFNKSDSNLLYKDLSNLEKWKNDWLMKYLYNPEKCFRNITCA